MHTASYNYINSYKPMIDWMIALRHISTSDYIAP